jgi:surface protein
MADILTEVGGNPATSTDYLQDIVLELGGTVTINGNWMEAWEAITATPPAVLFTTTWTTTAPSEQIFLPYGAGTYSGTIDWGDGNTDVNDGSVTSHEYATAGTYTVIIDGDCTGWYFGNAGGSPNITSVVNWGQLQLGPDNAGYNFYACPNLDLSLVSDTLDLTGVTVLAGLFNDCTSLTTINNINSWDTSAVTNMGDMFSGCLAFNQSLSFNTSAVTTMNSMFYNCTSFNQSLSFDTSAVTDMGGMFYGCSVFNQALSFDTSAVTIMNNMFAGCSVFNQPLSFDTSVVTDTRSMFEGAEVFNQNISSWNTGAFDRIDFMFNGATAFNQNIGNWDTSTVTSMSGVFQNADAFNQNIGTWNVENVANFSDFMLGKTDATFSTTNLNAIYNGWSTQAVQSSLDITFGTAKYTAAATAGRLILTGTALWTITDGGL